MPPDARAFPTGSLALDLATGGGWPRGAIVELYGDATSGKTTLALLAALAGQHEGDAAILDADRTFGPRYARALGLDLGRLVVARPDTGEAAVDIAQRLLRAGVTVLVVDGVAALVPASERGRSALAFEPATIAAHRRLVDSAATVLFAEATRADALVLCVNRPVRRPGRDGRAGAWIDATTGGERLPALADLRVRLTRLDGDARLTRSRVTVEKHVRAPAAAGRCTDMVIGWGRGIHRAADLLVAAHDAGVIAARGGSFFFHGRALGGQGEAIATLAGTRGDEVRVAVIERVRA